MLAEGTVSTVSGVEIRGEVSPQFAEILTLDALSFLASLERSFDLRRRELSRLRDVRQAEINAGAMPDFLPETEHIRNSEWTVAPIPPDLQDRRVEITGPVDRKMVINDREIHAMGGMAAQIPIKSDLEANRVALDKVRVDKIREAKDGHDGTWVAHPGLVSIAKEEFDKYMPTPDQIFNKLDDFEVSATELLSVPEGTISEE